MSFSLDFCAFLKFHSIHLPFSLLPDRAFSALIFIYRAVLCPAPLHLLQNFAYTWVYSSYAVCSVLQGFSSPKFCAFFHPRCIFFVLTLDSVPSCSPFRLFLPAFTLCLISTFMPSASHVLTIVNAVLYWCIVSLFNDIWLVHILPGCYLTFYFVFY